MATKRWVGRAGAVQQVTTVTVTGTVVISDTFTLTINTRDVTGVAVAATTTGAVDAIVAALALNTYAEFGELTTEQDANVLTVTGPTTGADFTLTGATSGSATVTVSTVTNPTGPNWWDNDDNWIEGAAPVSTDDVVIDEGPSILYGMDQSAVTLASLTFGQNWPDSSTCGLPRNSQPGNPESGYAEYRDQYLAISASVVTIECLSKRIRLNLGSVQTAVTVNNSGNADNGETAIDILGTHASNTVRVNKGEVGIGYPSGSVSTVATLSVAYRDERSNDAMVHVGSGVTLTTLKQTGGVIMLRCAATTVTREGGTLERWGSGAITTLNNRSGEMTDYGTGTITTLNNVAKWVRRGLAPLTVTNANLRSGSETIDTGGVVTWSNAPNLIECSLSAGQDTGTSNIAYFDFGMNKKITIADI